MTLPLKICTSIAFIFSLFITPVLQAQIKYPTPLEDDFIVKSFAFGSGEVLPELRLHYTTVGNPRKDYNNKIVNAVLIMHGTSGSGHQFLSDMFAGGLFGSGQLLDATKYFIILPDGIGHGKSSKPSDGLHMRFPKYDYDDMVKADYKLLTEHLHIDHLRLVMGTSMGGMHTWVWGYTHPGFMDALMPLASLPVAVAGRNRIQRKMAIDMIMMDPEWKGGEYATEPLVGLTGAVSSLIFMVSSPLQWQKSSPTRQQADSMLEKIRKRYTSTLDANDLIYQFDASRNYDPSSHLGMIKAPLFAINSADDQVNPPELKILDKEISKVSKGRYILLPITDKTSGHGTHSNPAIWGQYLKQLMALSEKK